MNITKEDKKEKCPKCGSKEILTLGLDQMCCDCDWDNTLLLVNLGQMDQPRLAAYEQFVKPKSFESLKSKTSTEATEVISAIRTKSPLSA
ncbi:MAG TPA: hypothetical protein VIG33_07220 [Pseudobdellovibrionaceae bacterium]